MTSHHPNDDLTTETLATNTSGRVSASSSYTAAAETKEEETKMEATASFSSSSSSPPPPPHPSQRQAEREHPNQDQDQDVTSQPGDDGSGGSGRDDDGDDENGDDDGDDAVLLLPSTSVRYRTLLNVMEKTLLKSRESILTDTVIQECYGDDVDDDNRDVLHGLFDSMLEGVRTQVSDEMMAKCLQEHHVEERLLRLERIVYQIQQDDEERKRMDLNDRESAKRAIHQATTIQASTASSSKRSHDMNKGDDDDDDQDDGKNDDDDDDTEEKLQQQHQEQDAAATDSHKNGNMTAETVQLAPETLIAIQSYETLMDEKDSLLQQMHDIEFDIRQMEEEKQQLQSESMTDHLASTQQLATQLQRTADTCSTQMHLS